MATKKKTTKKATKKATPKATPTKKAGNVHFNCTFTPDLFAAVEAERDRLEAAHGIRFGRSQVITSLVQSGLNARAE